MAVLETIRVKFGILITVLIAVALLSFIIDPSSLSMFGSDQAVEDTEVASINGTKVTYTEFNDQLRMYTNALPYEYYEASVLQQNPNMSTEEIKKLYNNELRSRVLNTFLMENLYIVKAKDAGFNVSEEEKYQLLSGQIYSNTIFNEFGGQMTPDLLIEIEANASPMWNSIKKSTEYERYMTKYTETFSKSLFSNSLLAEENIKNSNNVFDVEFVMVPFEAAGDTSIVVTEQEISDYYAAHKNLFPCTETRELDYIVVDVDAATEDEEFEKIDSVLNNVNGVENFRKAAIDNGYLVGSAPVNMFANKLGTVTGVETIIKWAFKESSEGGVSDIYTIENGDETYLVVVALDKINAAGYYPLEQVSPMIENLLYMEKAADKKLEEVAAKVNGLTDLNAVAQALGTSVSTRKNLTFASSDFDPKFTGAASVAEPGVLNSPLKGSNGIYVYKVTNASQAAFFTDNDAQMNDAQMNYMYGQVLPYVINQQGNIKDNTYLYF